MKVRVGAEVNLGANEVYCIDRIQNKYVAAHQDIFRDFPFLFGGEAGLERVEFDGNNFDPILKRLDARHDFVSSAVRMYRERQMPISTLCTILRESILDVWLALTRGSSEEKLWAAEGSEHETAGESATLAGAQEIVMDATAVLTTVRLSLEPLVQRRFKRIYVAQSLFDSFLEAETNIEYGPQKRGWMGKAGGQYYLAEADPTAENERKDILRKALAFLSTQAHIVACRSQLEYTSSKFAEYERVLGPDAVASILVAREHFLPLYCDDLALRVVARHDWTVTSFWTQRLLADCATRNIVTLHNYYSATASLIRERYHFVQIDSRYLTWLMQEHKLVLTAEVVAGINLLADAACSIHSAVNVAVGLIVSCWTSPIPSHLRYLVFDSVLCALKSNRSPQVVLQALDISLRHALINQPVAAAEVAQMVKLWKHFLFS